MPVMDNALKFARKKAAGVLLFGLLMSSAVTYCQSETPIPVMTGSVGYFTKVTEGQTENIPSIDSLLLAPIGDKWLIEAKSDFSHSWGNQQSGGEYGSSSSYGLAYAQVDYIANRYMTVVAGRFIQPFGIYTERVAPNWIRSLQATPLTVPITSGSALGGMVRGGFPLGTKKINLNYAVYFR